MRRFETKFIAVALVSAANQLRSSTHKLVRLVQLEFALDLANDG